MLSRVRRITSSRITAFMGLCGLAFILVSFAYVAAERRSQTLASAESELRNAAFFLADHAARLFEVSDLALQKATVVVGDRSWDAIEGAESLWRELRALKETLPYIEDVWLNDETGRLRLVTVGFPTPASNVADRDAFKAHLRPNNQIFVGEPITGRVTQRSTFLISRRLENRDGSFRGVISVTAALAYFNDYWNRLQLPDHARVTLFRAEDFAVLAEHPAPSADARLVRGDTAPLAAAIAASPSAGVLDASSGSEAHASGETRLLAYNRVGQLPLYVGATVSRDAVLRDWLRQLAIYAFFAGGAAVALAVLTRLGFRQAAEAATSRTRLESEVAARTAELEREIAERKQTEAQQSLLIRELHHRVKNTLATVQAVVSQTARSTTGIEAFQKAFVGRIVSLANTHSLLTEAVWQTASLRDLLEHELRPYNDESKQRITFDGPHVDLPSDVAVPLGMAVHELTTNAIKYGALSVPEGRVALRWWVEQSESAARLSLEWLERGGPPATPPERQGFGSRLLHRVLRTQLGAEVEMNFEPEGLRLCLATPLRTATLLDPVRDRKAS